MPIENGCRLLNLVKFTHLHLIATTWLARGMRCQWRGSHSTLGVTPLPPPPPPPLFLLLLVWMRLVGGAYCGLYFYGLSRLEVASLLSSTSLKPSQFRLTNAMCPLQMVFIPGFRFYFVFVAGCRCPLPHLIPMTARAVLCHWRALVLVACSTYHATDFS